MEDIKFYGAIVSYVEENSIPYSPFFYQDISSSVDGPKFVLTPENTPEFIEHVNLIAKIEHPVFAMIIPSTTELKEAELINFLNTATKFTELDKFFVNKYMLTSNVELIIEDNAETILSKEFMFEEVVKDASAPGEDDKAKENSKILDDFNSEVFH